MLRRKPTALTITSEDISQFEDLLSKNALPFQQQKQASSSSTASKPGNTTKSKDTAKNISPNKALRDAMNAQANVDPNDELKPLPGERARIVRTREDRILGRD